MIQQIAKRLFWTILALAVILAFIAISGCANLPPIPTGHGLGSTPPALNNTAKSLDFLIPVSLIGVAAGIAMFFIAPAAHRLSLAIATASGALLGVSLLLRVSLWLIPWIAGGAFVIALGILAYELYLKFHHATNSQP